MNDEESCQGKIINRGRSPKKKAPKELTEAADDNPKTIKSFGTLINEYDPMSIDSKLLYSYLKKEVL